MTRKSLQFENLEGRNLMTVLPDFAPPINYIKSSVGTTALIEGTNGPDTIILDFKNGLVVNNVRYTLDPLTRYIGIDANGGNDTILSLSSTFALPLVIHGGEGNDTIRLASNNIFDKAYGDEGYDNVNFNQFEDFIITDHDPFEVADVDRLGNTTWLYLYQTNGNSNNTVNITDGNVNIDKITDFRFSSTTSFIIDGNSGNDVIINNSNIFVVAFGGDGNDVIKGKRRDWLYGESGSDLITYF